ncbi:CCA-adding enzyme-like isoform X1 [Salvia hispanica]|uniref:CCA-adding enzyme-like isoform X1 n=1 Tax=Salvia hispanica TaxID=49212 RepID=UPI002009CBA0|nr:CCA-adding enzyme-like isoform X1 [Salvia hispanica]
MTSPYSSEARSLLSRLKPAFQRLKCSFVEERSRAHFSSHMGEGEFSKWRKLDSRKFGLERPKISVASWTVLRNLRAKGFEAYLVGGCVRDLLLNKVPKDFDVITTAGLKQVKRTFQCALIVGKRFPICIVTVKGSAVEVSSFDTIAKDSGEKAEVSQKPRGCDPRDFLRWKNCLHRDFTVNSLFFDPFANVIYDYTNAIMDLKSLKLRTVKPAHLSFKEDQARILRGLRLAARLNLSFSEETENALYSLSSSVANLSTSRIFMEMNYMLSYGAAERSLLKLKRFQLLDILLPLNAAYLSKQVHNQLGIRSSVLMKLFSNLDQLITCDRPCNDSLWVAILAFHLAICSNPQHPIVILTFTSLLHYRTMEESIRFARQNAQATRTDMPEIMGVLDNLLDDEIVERVTLFIEQVINSVHVLIKKESLLESITRFPEFPSSGLVFIPQKMGQKVKNIFNILGNGVNSVKANERGQELRHQLLKEGNVNETRFVLGKILATTLLHSKKRTQGSDAEDGKNDLLVTDQQQKLGDFEQTRNTAGHLSNYFAMDTNVNKRRATPSSYKKLSDVATKRTRLSDGEWGSKGRDSHSHGSNPGKKILKDDHVNAETRSNR